MKAKEMFERLGYECLSHHNVIFYANNKDCEYVQFTSDIHNTISVSEPIYVELLQAINKQVEELGWKG